MTQKGFWQAIPLSFLALSATVLLSQTVEAPKPDPPQSEEYLLLGSPNRGAGEPIIFVNPKDSNNMIVTAIATLHRLPTGEAHSCIRV